VIKSRAKQILPTVVWKWLRLARLQYSVHSYSRRVVSQNYCGFPLQVMLADPLAEGWYDHDWPSLLEAARGPKQNFLWPSPGNHDFQY
jgi:hypothetical protein